MLKDLALTIERLRRRYGSAAAFAVRHLDGLVSLLLRLILAPVLINAGWTKITGRNWFASQLDSFPFPFNVLPPDFSWWLAAGAEFGGGIALLFGLCTRILCIPLAVTMFVAAYAVHLDNGWAAIAPSNPPAACREGTSAGLVERAIRCRQVNARTLRAAERLAEAKAILREHGDYRELSQGGAFVKLNNGIEFAAMYMAMLLALMIIGGGRYFSLDYYLKFALRRQAP